MKQPTSDVPVQLAQKSLVTALPSSNKAVLVGIKASFSFSWAFMNAICYFLTGRCFSMMTGNTVILSVETSQWKTKEMMLTATLITLFVCGGAAYDSVSLWLKNEDKVVKLYVVPSCIFLGVASDVIQFVMGSCSSGRSGDECTGMYLYFLTPMALLAGNITSYLATHPDGIITHMITAHMKIFPNAALKRVFQGKGGSWEKACLSFLVITFFFLGGLSGALVSEQVLVRYSKGRFTPLFTSFAIIMAALTLMHFTLCEQFCYKYQLENKIIEKAQAIISANGMNAIAYPEKCIRNIHLDELEDLVRKTTLATLTNIIRSAALNQIANSEHVSANGVSSTSGSGFPPMPQATSAPLRPLALMFLERAHGDLMSKLQDDFYRRYGVDIVNIQMGYMKIMDNECLYQILKQALTTTRVEHELANLHLHGQSLILTQKECTPAEVPDITVSAEAKKLMDAENESERKIEAAESGENFSNNFFMFLIQLCW
mmetsp:Transcript_5651/g.10207  ORF Transcript_5651/g.10207 Transcript_5651/m.10207 type:complete len:487 (+) Transcript_5651:271-1731(+)|eukprot:CAMPEP_0183729306 /NCGR_PEP_ID=MMETSP0737-20130205/30010_1 /TAXON_ID=385413 /ORGANISM="Thalassiosira miniscula, Strain CCMP1093" /LENGTH=486 /DNA_ID=CAMNT_0025961457 /DNA_START=383 /DNA_END=1843 /DNA_ORIENTATION=+